MARKIKNPRQNTDMDADEYFQKKAERQAKIDNAIKIVKHTPRTSEMVRDFKKAESFLKKNGYNIKRDSYGRVKNISKGRKNKSSKTGNGNGSK